MINFLKKLFTSEPISMNHNIEGFKQGNFAVQCKTSDDVLDFADYLDKHNIGYWRDGELFKNNNKWYDYNKYSCYKFTSRGITYSYLGYFDTCSVKVIDFNDLIDKGDI